MIIKQDGKSRAFPWREGVFAFALIAASIGVFCLTSRPQRQAISKLTAGLNFGQPAEALVENLAPSFPSLDLIPRLCQRMTILLIGVDSNGLNADAFLGTRSDTMMLISIDPDANRLGVISIPRDSRVVVPNHGTDKINSAHALGGAELSMQTVREFFGVPVDHYVEVDTAGLKKLFEILGPVEVLVEKDMHYVDHSAKLNVDLQAGLQQLTPEQAEQYVRYRNDGRGDVGRIERQQWFIRQAARKFKDPQIVLKLPQLVSLAYQCVRTDLSVQDAMSIAAYARDFPQEKVVTATLPGEARWLGGGSYWVPDPVADQVVFSRILGISAQPLSVDGAPTAPSLTPDPAQNAALPPSKEINPASRDSKPPAVAIKYPAGCEQLSLAVAEQLTQAGFRVKYRYQIAESDCRHEMLVQQSLRAGEEATGRIFQAIPEIANFPLSMAIESRPAADFLIIISPTSEMPSICHSRLAPSVLQQKAPPLNLSAGAVPVLPQE